MIYLVAHVVAVSGGLDDARCDAFCEKLFARCDALSNVRVGFLFGFMLDLVAHVVAVGGACFLLVEPESVGGNEIGEPKMNFCEQDDANWCEFLL
jgi:hypothetical protein